MGGSGTAVLGLLRVGIDRGGGGGVPGIPC